MGSLQSKEEGSEPKPSQVLTECESKKHGLENTVSHFLQSVNSLQCTATYFAEQFKKTHDTKGGSDEEMYRSAIKVLLTSQELNKNLKKRFENEFKEFFVSIADVITKEMRVTLPHGFETFNFLSESGHEQQHDDTAVDESIEHKTDEVLLKDELLKMSEKENDILKDKLDVLSLDIDVRVYKEQIRNLKADVTKLQADKRKLEKQLDDARKIETKIDQLTSTNTELTQACKEKDDLILELRKSVDDTENKVNDLTKVCEEKETIIKEMKTKNERMQTDIHGLNASKAHLTNDMRIKSDLILEHIKENQRLDTVIENLRKNVKSKEEEINCLKTNEAILTEKYEEEIKLRNEVSRVKAEMAVQKSENEKLVNENEKMIKEMEITIVKLTEDGNVKDKFNKEQIEQVRKMKTAKEELESENERLRNDCIAKDKNIESFSKEVRIKESEIEELTARNRVLVGECQTKCADIMKLNDEVKIMVAEINELTSKHARDICEKDKIITDISDISDKRMSEINELTEDCGLKDVTIASLRDDVNEMTAKFESLKTTNGEITHDCLLKDKTINDLNSRNKDLINECLEKSNAITKLEARNKEIEIESDGRFAKILQLQDEAKQKCKEFLDMKAERNQLADELRILKSKMLLRVNLFCHHRSNIITNIVQALMIILKEKIEENQLELNFVQFTDNFDDNGDPTIALCMTTSRIGTDAENAVKDMSMSAKTALLMIHHKDEHALPQQASERVLTSPGFKQLGCITDMAFLSGKGFFPCEINNNSIVRLVNFIRKEGVKYRKHDS